MFTSRTFTALLGKDFILVKFLLLLERKIIANINFPTTCLQVVFDSVTSCEFRVIKLKWKQIKISTKSNQISKKYQKSVEVPSEIKFKNKFLKVLTKLRNYNVYKVHDEVCWKIVFKAQESARSIVFNNFHEDHENLGFHIQATVNFPDKMSLATRSRAERICDWFEVLTWEKFADVRKLKFSSNEHRTLFISSSTFLSMYDALITSNRFVTF